MCSVAIASCPQGVTSALHGCYTWTNTSAEASASLDCQYYDPRGIVPRGTVTRLCNEYAVWEAEDLAECITFVRSELLGIAVRTLVSCGVCAPFLLSL